MHQDYKNNLFEIAWEDDSRTLIWKLRCILLQIHHSEIRLKQRSVPLNSCYFLLHHNYYYFCCCYYPMHHKYVQLTFHFCVSIVLIVELIPLLYNKRVDESWTYLPIVRAYQNREQD